MKRCKALISTPRRPKTPGGRNPGQRCNRKAGKNHLCAEHSPEPQEETRTTTSHRLTPTAREILDQLARQEGITRSAILELAIRHYQEHHATRTRTRTRTRSRAHEPTKRNPRKRRSQQGRKKPFAR